MDRSAELQFGTALSVRLASIAPFTVPIHELTAEGLSMNHG